MAMSENELPGARDRVSYMYADTIVTFEMIAKKADAIYGDKAQEVQAAINECLADFEHNTGASGEPNPTLRIYNASKEMFQRAGFYGAQLELKEQQVKRANKALQDMLSQDVVQFWKKPFKKWIDTINNFLSSLASVAGLEALKELKDCLRDQLPDDDTKESE
jgi:hypothetical protein